MDDRTDQDRVDRVYHAGHFKMKPAPSVENLDMVR